MKIFLKIINPIIAIIVFILCFYAATVENGNFEISKILEGAFSTYFFAKGIFTSCLLFITGYFLLLIIEQKNQIIKYLKRDFIIIFTSVLLLISLYLVPTFISDNPFKREIIKPIPIINPKGIEITKHYRIAETTKLKIGGIVKNNSKHNWKDVNISVDVYSSGNLIEKDKITIESLKINSLTNFIIVSDDIYNSSIKNKIKFIFTISAISNK